MEYSGGTKKLLWSLPPSSCLFFSMKTQTQLSCLLASDAQYSAWRVHFQSARYAFWKLFQNMLSTGVRGKETELALVAREQTFRKSGCYLLSLLYWTSYWRRPSDLLQGLRVKFDHYAQYWYQEPKSTRNSRTDHKLSAAVSLSTDRLRSMVLVKSTCLASSASFMFHQLPADEYHPIVSLQVYRRAFITWHFKLVSLLDDHTNTLSHILTFSNNSLSSM